MSDWRDRKEARRAHFEKHVKGWKLVRCVACNGSGRYDHNGSPKCGSCNGTGKMRVKPEDYAFYAELMKPKSNK